MILIHAPFSIMCSTALDIILVYLSLPNLFILSPYVPPNVSDIWRYMSVLLARISNHPSIHIAMYLSALHLV
jgi:hypothetical protein